MTWTLHTIANVAGLAFFLLCTVIIAGIGIADALWERKARKLRDGG